MATKRKTKTKAQQKARRNKHQQKANTKNNQIQKMQTAFDTALAEGLTQTPYYIEARVRPIQSADLDQLFNNKKLNNKPNKLLM